MRTVVLSSAVALILLASVAVVSEATSSFSARSILSRIVFPAERSADSDLREEGGELEGLIDSQRSLSSIASPLLPVNAGLGGIVSSAPAAGACAGGVAAGAAGVAAGRTFAAAGLATSFGLDSSNSANGTAATDTDEPAVEFLLFPV